MYEPTICAYASLRAYLIPESFRFKWGLVLQADCYYNKKKVGCWQQIDVTAGRVGALHADIQRNKYSTAKVQQFYML